MALPGQETYNAAFGGGAWQAPAQAGGSFLNALMGAKSRKAQAEKDALDADFKRQMMREQIDLRRNQMALAQAEKNRLSPTDLGKLSEEQEGVVQLEELKKQVPEFADVMGPVKSRVLQGASVLGVNTPAALKYKKFESFMRDVRQAYGKAREGGVLRKEDEAKYEAIVGSPNMTSQQAQEVLDLLSRRTRESYERKTGALKGAKYTVPKELELPVKAPVDKKALAQQALNDPDASPQHKAAAKRILGMP